MLSNDPVWSKLHDEINNMAKLEPILSEYLHSIILDCPSIEDSLSIIITNKIRSPKINGKLLQELICSTFKKSDSIRKAIRRDLKAIVDRDPAVRGYSEPFLYFKGFHALEAYRVAHVLWIDKRFSLALFLQSRITEAFSLDIHPAAKIGSGILIDHGTGVVIGETAVIGNDVSLLHEVTLGGTGKDKGDRHPKVGNGVLIGAGAKILGNVNIGDGSKIGAGSVVLDDVPSHCTVAGVPAKILGHPRTNKPSLSMDQRLEIEDQIDLSYVSSML